MKKSINIPFMLLALAMGWVLGILSGMMLSRIPNLSGTEELGLNILVSAMLFVYYFAGIILHEAGHLVFGLLTGWRFVSFRVANIIWLRGKDGRIRRGRYSLAGTGGQCLLAPPPWREEGFPYALYNMGGVIVNLATAVVCGLLAAIFWSRPLAALLLMEAALMGLYLAVINGVPFPGMIINNDGGNQLHMRMSRDARRGLWIEMSIAEAMTEGQRLDEMPDQWFEPFPEESRENPLVSSIAVLAQERLLCAFDLPGAEAAARALLQREKGLIPLHRALVTLDGAFCELVGGHPGEMTEAMDKPPVPQLMKSMKRSFTVLRTRYAEALLRQHDEALAAEYAEAFEEVAETYPFPQEIENERQLMALAKEAAMTIRQATPSDLPEVARLALALWPENEPEALSAELAPLLQSPEAAVFLCLEAERAVGFAQCQLRRDYVEGCETSPVGYLEGVYVEAAYRRRGVAKALVTACQDWARGQGCQEFASDCELDNVDSLRFHLGAGFDEANRIICFTRKL